MLKLIYIIVLTIIFTAAHAQPQREPAYKYSYNITVPISACAASVVQDSVKIEEQQPSIEIEVKDCNNNPISSAKISLTKSGTSAVKNTTDEKGMISTPIQDGEYVLTITSKEAAQFTQTVSLSQNYKLHIKVMMQSKPVKQHYIIRAKYQLLQAEREMIKQCISDHNGDASKCGRKAYYIMTEI